MPTLEEWYDGFCKRVDENSKREREAFIKSLAEKNARIESDRARIEAARVGAIITEEQIARAYAGEHVTLPDAPREAFIPPPGLAVYSMTYRGKTICRLYNAYAEADAASKRIEAEKKSNAEQPYMLFDPMTKGDAEVWLSRNNPESPFYKFVGNDGAVSMICEELVCALMKNNHHCKARFGLYGPGGVGKTELAKLIGETLELPFLRIDGTRNGNVKNTKDLLEKIEETLVAYDEKLELVSGCAPEHIQVTETSKTLHIPPMVIYIDEIHGLSSDFANSLYSAIEPHDVRMSVTLTEKQDGYDGTFEVYTDQICWIIATTNKGDLPKALQSRFTPIYLKKYSVMDLAKIVRIKYNFPAQVCGLIAMHFRGSARECVAFSDMLEEKVQGLSLEEMLALVLRKAKELGVNIHGLNESQMKVLEILGTEEKSIEKLASAIGVEEKELRKDILPALMNAGEGYPQLVHNVHRGLGITDEGRKFLEKLNVANR
jgi:Holliday junction resolvasome RuvABC ATP-dependent DNA helicase subunit